MHLLFSRTLLKIHGTFSYDLLEVRSIDDDVSITDTSEQTKNIKADTNASGSKVRNLSQEKLLFSSSCSKSSSIFRA